MAYYALICFGPRDPATGAVSVLSGGAYHMPSAAQLEYAGVYLLRFDTESALLAHLSQFKQFKDEHNDCSVLFDSVNGWAEDIPSIVMESNSVVDVDCIGGSNSFLGNLIEYGLWFNQFIGKEEVLDELTNMREDDFGMRPIAGIFGRYNNMPL